MGYHLHPDPELGERSNAEHRTGIADVVPGPQNDLRSDEPRSARHQDVLLGTAGIGRPRVRNESDGMQTNKATAETKKTCNTGLFEAADGIRTHDLLHGKQNPQ
jgi:hypothetical protein